MKPYRYRNETDEHYQRKCERMERRTEFAAGLKKVTDAADSMAAGAFRLFLFLVVLGFIGSCAIMSGMPL